MQIDFHHTATYVVARDAGLGHEVSKTVAHAAQYVDDATNSGEIYFTDGVQIYRRLASAHKMLDYRNLSDLKNSICWMPFHFLPGNCDVPLEKECKAPIEERVICLPNSPIAQDMMKATLADKGKPYDAHRLGIAAHTFMDTFAHQQFAGMDSIVNQVKDLRYVDESGNASPDATFDRRIREFFSQSDASLIGRLRHSWKREHLSILEKVKDVASHVFQDKIPTLGHGQALSYPDRPYANWTYVNGQGKPVLRNNPKDFLTACDKLCVWMRRWQLGDPNAPSDGLSENVRVKIQEMIAGTLSSDGHKRHLVWLDALKGDYFGFGPVDLKYVGKGIGSWKHSAVGSKEEYSRGKETYDFDVGFISSDWKLFHDAAKLHQLTILDDILPKYGIVAA